MWFFISQSFAWTVASAPMPKRSQQQLITFSAWSCIIKNTPRLAILLMIFGIAEHGRLPYYSSKTQTLLSIPLEDASFVMVLFSTGLHFILGCLTCSRVKVIAFDGQNAELHESTHAVNQPTQINFFQINNYQQRNVFINNDSDDSAESGMHFSEDESPNAD